MGTLSLLAFADGSNLTWLAPTIVAVGGVLGTIFGWVKYLHSRRDNKIEDRLSAKLDSSIEQVKIQNEQQSELIDKLDRTQREEANSIKKVIHENEMDRLRTEIMIFTCNLRNGMKMDGADFHHIHRAYDKYKKLGGNSYIDADMAYIKEKELELKITIGE